MSEYEPGTHVRISWSMVVMYCLLGVMIGLTVHFDDYPGTWIWLYGRIFLGLMFVVTVAMVIAANITRIRNRQLRKDVIA